MVILPAKYLKTRILHQTRGSQEPVIAHLNHIGNAKQNTAIFLFTVKQTCWLVGRIIGCGQV